MKSWIFLFAFGIMLALGNTWIHQNRFDFGSELLPPLTSFDGDKEWSISNKKAVSITGDRSAILDRNQGSALLTYKTEEIENFRYVLLSSKMRTENATQGGANYALARIAFYGENEKGVSLWKYPHVLMSQQNTSPWRKQEAVFEIYPEMKRIEVSAQMLAKEGRMFVEDISAKPAFEKSFYKFGRAGFGIAWLVWLFILFRQLSKESSSTVLTSVNAIIVATAFLVTVFPGVNRSIQPLLPIGFAKSIAKDSALPSVSDKDETIENTVAESSDKGPEEETLVPETSKPEQTPESEPSDPPRVEETKPPPSPSKKQFSPWRFISPHKKIFHVLVFASFVFGSCFCIRRSALVGGLYLAFALLSETIQYYQTRQFTDGDKLDLALNILGVPVGVWAWLALMFAIKRFRNTEPHAPT